MRAPVAMRALATGLLLIGLLGVDAAVAQPTLQDRLGRPSRPELPEIEPAPAPAPLPELPPLPPPPEREPPLSAGPRVLVEAIRLSGNTVFSDQDLASIIEPYVGRAVTIEDLLDLRDAITRRYVEAGYVNSGALIPDQEISGGVIEVMVVEGELTEVVVDGLESLRPAFVEDRIRLGAEPPLNIERLRERIQLLLLDPAIDQINARLGPGRRRGEGRLELDVKEAPRYQTEFRFANDRSPAVGAPNGALAVTFGNVLGLSDPVRFELDVSEGLTDFTVDYSVPLTASDLRFFIAGEATHAKVVEKPFSELNVESDFGSIEAGLSWPVIRTLDDEVRLEAKLERWQSTTSLLDRSFSLSPGAEDGRTDVTALRLVQQWQRRSQDQALALRSTASIGLDLFGATERSGNVADGQFFAWLGQGQFARRLFGSDWQLNLRGDLQLAKDPLVPIERLSIGGVDTVRGYRKNQLLVDSGWITSAELRIPLGRIDVPGLSQEPDDGLLQLVPFVDVGGGWNIDAPDPDKDVIAGTGAGLRWQPNRYLDLRFDYGYQLVNVQKPQDDDLQDMGIYFAMVVRFQ